MNRTRPLRQVARARGMTLIEILVVVVIIALMAAVVTVAVGALGGDTEIDDEARRFTDVVAVAYEQAELEGRDYGLRLEPAAYEVMVFDGLRGWIEVEGDDFLRSRELPPGLGFALQIEGRPVLLKRAETPESRLPQIVTFASGEVTPYRLVLSRPASGAEISLEGAVDGTIEIGKGDADR